MFALRKYFLRIFYHFNSALHSCLYNYSNYKKRKLAFAVFILFNFSQLSFVNAEPLGKSQSAQSVFSFKDLLVSCPSCRQVSASDCEILIDNELTIMPCELGLSVMLQDAHNANQKLNYPTSDNIIIFLLANDVAASLAKQLLMILFKELKPSVFLVENIEHLLRKYSDLTIELLPNFASNQQLLELIWQQPLSLPTAQSALLQATVVKFSEKLTDEDLLLELDGLTLSEELERLKIYAAVFADEESVVAERLQTVLSLATACIESKQDFSLCQLGRSVLLTPRWDEYLTDLRLRVFAELALSALTVSERMAWIGTFSSAQLRQGRLSHILSQSLSDATKLNDSEVYLILNQPAVDEMLRAVMQREATKGDEIVRENISSIYLIAASEAERRNELEKAVDYLEVAAKPDSSSKQAKQISLLQDKLLVMAKSTGNELQTKRLLKLAVVSDSNRLFVLVLAAVAIAGLFFTACLFQLKRSRFKSVADIELNDALHLTASVERQELRELMEYFRITPPGKATLLTRRYRDMAKVLHPDAGGDLSSFVELNDKYQRAQNLLLKVN